LKISKNPSNVIVDASGNIRVGTLQLEPGQVASMSAMQQSDPKAASAFGAMLMHTAVEREKILKARADFDNVSTRASSNAKSGISSYLYRLNLRRPHRSSAVEDVVWMRGAKTTTGKHTLTSSLSSSGPISGILHTSESTSRETNRSDEKEKSSVKFKESSEQDSEETSQVVERALAEIQEQKELQDEDQGVSGSISKLNLSNTADSRGALTAMRLVTEREALLDEADSLAIVLEVLPLISINRPAGLSGIERSLINLLRQTTITGVSIDKAFVFRMFSLLHDAVLSLPSSELHLPENLSSFIKRGEDHSQLGPNAYDDPSILAFSVGGSRDGSKKKHAEIVSQKRLLEVKHLEEQALQDSIKEERETAAAIIRERKRKLKEEREKNEKILRDNSDAHAERKKYDAFTSRAGMTPTRPSSAMPILTSTNTSLTTSSGIASLRVRPSTATRFHIESGQRTSLDDEDIQDSILDAKDRTLRISTSRPTTASSSLRPTSGATMRPTSAATMRSTASTRRLPPSPPKKTQTGEELEPLYSMPEQLLSHVEQAAKVVRRSWPTTLYRPLALLCSSVGITEGEFALWLSQHELEFPTEERSVEIDQRAKERARREHEEGLM